MVSCLRYRRQPNYPHPTSVSRPGRRCTSDCLDPPAATRELRWHEGSLLSLCCARWCCARWLRLAMKILRALEAVRVAAAMALDGGGRREIVIGLIGGPVQDLGQTHPPSAANRETVSVVVTAAGAEGRHRRVLKCLSSPRYRAAGCERQGTRTSMCAASAGRSFAKWSGFFTRTRKFLAPWKFAGSAQPRQV